MCVSLRRGTRGDVRARRVWTLWAFIFSFTLAFASDSPLAVGKAHWLLGVVFVVGFTCFVEIQDRQMHRRDLVHIPRLRRIASSDLSFMRKADAKQRVEAINDAVSRIDRQFVPSTFGLLMNRAEVTAAEGSILASLTAASSEELNYILTNVQLALVMYKTKDHRRGASSRTALLALLCETRLTELVQ